MPGGQSRRTAHPSLRWTQEPGRLARTCDEPGCANDGDYRAPQARDRLRDYHWFCLEHVQAYNRSWNYHAGMNEDEMELEVRRDTVWRRPSWPFGLNRRPAGVAGRAADPFGVLGGRPRGAGRRQDAAGPGYSPAEVDALAVLDLEPGVSRREIKTRYKTLAKRYHPDANGGDRAAEERLKLVNRAYSTLTAAQ